MDKRYSNKNVRKDGICPLAEYDWKEPFADTFMNLENEHPYIRYTKAYCNSWEKTEPGIGSGELIVGIPRPPRVITTAYHTKLVFNKGLYDKITESCEDKMYKEMRKFSDYFRKHHVTSDLINDMLQKQDLGIDESIGAGPGYQGHILVDFEKVLRIGISGLEREIKENIKDCSDAGKEAFYKALLICCDCIKNICVNYSDKALELHNKTSSKARTAELAEIANICRSISEGAPPKTLREALQLFWFIFLFDGNDNPGRFDQYMYPFYKNDIETGRISKDMVRKLIEDLWHKMEQVVAWSLVLGGQNQNGDDASNDLTYLCLDVTADLKLINPAVSVRVHSKTPNELWLASMKSIAQGGGMPAIVNDDAIIPALVRSGIAEADAYDYGLGGCIEYQIAGKCNFGGEDGHLNLAKCLELALNNGVCNMTGKMIGIATGNPLAFKNYHEVFNAYKRQVEWAVEKIVGGCNIGQEIKSKQGTKIYRSLLIDDCIKNGLDCEGGGARYGNGQILTNGAVVVSDSLAVIKYLVFEQNYVSMSDLISALKSNWQGFEILRLYILNHSPHFGNDDDRVDNIAYQVCSHIWGILEDKKTYRGGHYTGLVVYYDRQQFFGRKTGATPDGRLKGEVLEDSLGPWPGRDTNGPTAMLKSIVKMPLLLASGGATLNLKLSPNCLNGSEQIEKSASLIKTYFKLGGQHVQVTVVNAEDLKAAFKEPEKWRHIIVRVGGYSAYFTDLSKELQESIILRNENLC